MHKRSHGAFVLLTKAYHGGVITSADTAVGVASAILKGHYGESELLRQQPLGVSEQKDSWLVEGSYVDPKLAPEGGGSWYIRLMRDDGRVVELGIGSPRWSLATRSRTLKDGRSLPPPPGTMSLSLRPGRVAL